MKNLFLLLLVLAEEGNPLSNIEILAERMDVSGGDQMVVEMPDEHV